MLGKKTQRHKGGCRAITIGNTPIVKVLRRIFYAVIIACGVIANVTIFDKNIPEVYRVVFTQYIIGVFIILIGVAILYFGCKYSTVS